jgi:ABC-type nitrate/sulfonate/bicarbonate transport system substrate-binding protein
MPRKMRRNAHCMMKTIRLFSQLFLALIFTAFSAGYTRAAELRVGYWTSGISLGFGALLEAQKFFEKQGLQVKFVRFPDVNGPTTALAANAIDLAFGASLAGAFSLSQQGVPVRIVAATQLVDAELVVLADSPVRNPGELRGKKIGMSPLGSGTTGVGTAVLDGNYGLKLADYRLIAGDEPRLAQFLLQKNVDAAVIRPTTVAQVSDNANKIRVLGTLSDQWKQMTKSSAPPYIGVAVMRSEWLQANPADAVKVLAAMREAVQFGTTHPDAVIAALKQTANISDEGARFYGEHWASMNTVAMGPDDIATLKRTFDVFKAAGTLKGDLPAQLFDPQPFLEAEKTK